MNERNGLKAGFINRLGMDILGKRPHPREEDLRGPFFRDTTAIIHSYPFRGLNTRHRCFLHRK